MLYEDYLSPFPVKVRFRDLLAMARVAKLLNKLAETPAYRMEIAGGSRPVVQFDPNYGSVFMCYDFHLGEDGPQLIEVNTNAGGGLLALLAHAPAASLAELQLDSDLKQQLVAAFVDTYRAYSGDPQSSPGNVFIVDEQPQEQFLFQEMQAFAKVLGEFDINVGIVGPEQLDCSANGVYIEGVKADLLYMRHCDFYLDDPSMAALKGCYLAGLVCLSPNPFDYALLSDKRRLIQFSDVDFLKRMGLSQRQCTQLLRYIPRAQLLAEADEDEIWAQRKKLVFKPVEGFGSQDIYFGKKISRVRFSELDPDGTLVQQLVPPSTVAVPEQESMKADFRLFAFKDRIFGLTARLYRGRLTNMQTQGGGFAVVSVEKESSL
jgi:hypothetical protein